MTNFSSIDSRYKWAKLQRKNLELSVKAYSRNYPYQWKAEIAKDRLSWRIVILIKKNRPFTDWAYRHANIVHDLRSLLDNAVWLIAHENNTPARPKDLEFPIVVDRTKWLSASNKVAQLPENYRKIIESVQPFERDPNDPIGSTLKLVHELDIQNKHHAPIVTGVSDLQELQNNFQIIYKSELEPNDTVDVTPSAFKFENNHVVWQQTAPKLIDTVRGHLVINAHFVIQNESGHQYPLIGSLDHMLAGCKKVMENLASV